MAVQAVNGVAVRAPVLVVPGSMVIHLPTIHRLGRGTHKTPISTYAKRGFLPVHWTTVCGQLGVVIINQGEIIETTPVCPACQAIEVS